MTEEQYSATRNADKIKNNPKEVVLKHIVKVDEADKKTGRVAFEMSGVRAGEYAIIAFQDVNSNGLLDKGVLGPIVSFVVVLLS